MAIVNDVEQARQVIKEIKRDQSNIERVLDYLSSQNISAQVTIHNKAVSAEVAAEEMDCSPQQIIKTLVFMADGEPLLVLVQGTREVDLNRLKQVVNAEQLQLARPSEVETETGYRVGSVSPFDLELPVVVDAPILDQNRIRPAAGSTCVGAVLQPADLLDQLAPKLEQISRRPEKEN